MTTDLTIRIAGYAPLDDADDVREELAALSDPLDFALAIPLSSDGETLTGYGCNTQARPERVDDLDAIVEAYPGSQYVVMEEGIATDEHAVHYTWAEALDELGLTVYEEDDE